MSPRYYIAVKKQQGNTLIPTKRKASVYRVHLERETVVNLESLRWILITLAYRDIYFPMYRDTYRWLTREENFLRHIFRGTERIINQTFLPPRDTLLPLLFCTIIIYIRGKLGYRHNSSAAAISSDNPTIRPHRNASVASDIVHFPIIDAFIIWPPCELFGDSVYKGAFTFCKVSRLARLYIFMGPA